MLKQPERGWTVHEALAVGRLRQWAQARSKLKRGKSPVLQQMRGRASHTNRSAAYDGAVVFVVDFEAALETLPGPEKALLVLRFRDGQSQEAVATAIGMSVRTVTNWETQAIRRLAAALDERDLL